MASSNPKIITDCIIELTYLGLLKVSGPDAQLFLQGQLTCHINDIISNRFGLGAHCNPHGRIISFFQIIYHEDNFYLQMPYQLVPIALNALKKYAVFFKVTLEDFSKKWKSLGYCGEAAIINHLLEKRPDLFIIHSPQRLEIIGEADVITELRQKIFVHCKPAEEEFWHLLNIRAGMPTIYPQTSEKFLPHEIYLPQLNAVSFDKGCFTGQEIIARMHYRGKLKNNLLHASFTTKWAPARGGDIYSFKGVVGSIIDFAKKTDDDFEVLIITSQQENLFLDPLFKYPLDIHR